MGSVKYLQSFEQLKLLADPRRYAILQQLMAGPASLTVLGKALGEHPAWIRHHLKKLEAAGLVELVEVHIQSGVVEKFYRACADGFLVQELIVPEKTAHPVVVFSGSHDLAFGLLADLVSDYLDVLTMTVGSLDGLIALRQNLCHLTGTHLLDPGGEYNVPFIRHFFPDRPMHLITLAHREQGLMTAAGNPKSIRSLMDLTRPEVTFVNRNPGSGTRLWFDNHLLEKGISPGAIHGYENTVSTHTACASLIHSGKADAALGLRASAHQFGLDFIPLFHERYDLVFMHDQSQSLAPLLDTLQAHSFRHSVTALTGYDTTHTGEEIPL
ncbi:MAG: helix-turn-helix domain-containing protein [Anaerolineae bacterium]|nr:helix-turn-helix domain-containing protein [Anaerolineae bacterium]